MPRTTQRTGPPVQANSTGDARSARRSSPARRPKSYAQRADGKNDTGAPSLYREEYNHIVEVACKQHGLGDQQLAELLNVAPNTIALWRREHPEFLAAIRRGKDEHDSREVESTMLKRAKGYDYTQKRTETVEVDAERPALTDSGEPILDAKGRPVMLKVKVPAVKYTETTMHVSPDVVAGIFWLTNRQRDRWQHMNRIIHSGDPKNPIKSVYNLDELTRSELEQLQALIRKSITVAGSGVLAQGPEQPAGDGLADSRAAGPGISRRVH